MASASTTCPFCARYSHFTIRWGRVLKEGDALRFAAECDHCGEISAARGVSGYRYGNSIDLGQVKEGVASSDLPLEWYPRVGVAPTVDDVPVHIQRAAQEAYSSASVGNHMAAILMARTVIEASAKEKDILSGNLFTKINALKDASFIRPAIAEQAHEVRFAGNDMAHGDIDVAPDATDSEEILALMAEVLSEIFQGPARLERIRAKRNS